MYNTFLYNTTLYWTLSRNKGWGGWWWGWVDIIGFNWYNFSDIIISNIPDDYAWHSISVETYQLSTHGQGLWNWLIKNKTLSINGRIVAENQVQLEDKIKKIKTNLLQWQSVLYLKRASEILQTTAVVSRISIPRETWTVNAIEIEIIFTILDPFFYSVQRHELAYYWISSDFYTSLFYETWSHSAKVWVFVMFGSWTNVSKVSLLIWDKTVKVNESFVAWDILYLDWENVDVAKNGRYGIDRYWEVWELTFWENPIIINATWVANYSVFIQYRDTYV